MSAIELYTTPLFNDANLKDYYRFEGNSNDAKGSNNGSDTSVSYNSSYGMFGQGVHFTGGPNGGNITLTNTSFTQPTGAFTITAWEKGTGTDANTATVYSSYYRTVDGEQRGILLSAGTVAHIQVGDDTCSDGNFSTHAVVANGTITTNDNAWHFVAATYDGVNTLKIYTDGIDMQFSVKAITAGYTSATTNIGCYKFGSTPESFTGNIDDLAIFNRVLTASEILKIYNGAWQTTNNLASFRNHRLSFG